MTLEVGRQANLLGRLWRPEGNDFGGCRQANLLGRLWRPEGNDFGDWPGGESFPGGQ